jgi:hypothetical protein
LISDDADDRDGRTVGSWSGELAGATVINLVDKRPTARNVELLRRSRVAPTSALVAAVSSVSTQASTSTPVTCMRVRIDGAACVGFAT